MNYHCQADLHFLSPKLQLIHLNVFVFDVLIRKEKNPTLQLAHGSTHNWPSCLLPPEHVRTRFCMNSLFLLCLSRKQLVTSSENEFDPLRASILTLNQVELSHRFKITGEDKALLLQHNRLKKLIKSNKNSGLLSLTKKEFLIY